MCDTSRSAIRLAQKFHLFFYWFNKPHPFNWHYFVSSIAINSDRLSQPVYPVDKSRLSELRIMATILGNRGMIPYCFFAIVVTSLL